MEDGPEEANGSYDYTGRTFRLDERDSEEWRVFDAGVYIGTVRAVRGEGTTGPQYTIDIAGDGPVDEPATDDWRRALETLIDLGTP